MKDRYLRFFNEVYDLCKKGEAFSMTQLCSNHGIDTTTGTILTKVGVVSDTGYREKSRRIYEWHGESPNMNHFAMVNKYKIEKPSVVEVIEKVDDGLPKSKRKNVSVKNTYTRNDRFLGYFD